MAEESTRRLLKVFGIAVTDLEERVQELLAALGGLKSKDPATVIKPLEEYLKASGALMKHWAEVGKLLSDTHERANTQLLPTLSQFKAQ